jgi:chloramphenicol-sensitive protein RarD
LPGRSVNSMSALRRGYLFGLAAYGLWGGFPLYFKLLQPTPPVEILAHRIVWSVAFVALLLAVVRKWAFLRPLLRRPRAMLGIAAAAAIIAVNWGTYIYGVNTERVVETSLGYFINPLVTVLLGVLVLRERLRRWQWVALGIGAVAVTMLTIDYGRLPYIALILAGSFGTYGLIKKTLGLPAVQGLFVETTLLAAPALGFLWWLSAQGTATVGQIGATHTLLVLAAGAVTAVPLLLFAGAANRIPLTALGMLQYVAPVIQFGLGVFAFAEPMPPARLAGFTLVWLALLILTVEAIRHLRHNRAREREITPAMPPAEPAR